MCRYVRSTRTIVIIGCAGLLAFTAAMVSVQPSTETRAVTFMFLACCSVGIVETCSLSLAPLTCPSEDLGSAVGVLGSIRSAGASVAISVSVTILNNKMKDLLPKYVEAAVVQAGFPVAEIPSLLTNLTAGTLLESPEVGPAILLAVGDASAKAAADSFR
jgi:hypothetical protein